MVYKPLPTSPVPGAAGTDGSRPLPSFGQPAKAGDSQGLKDTANMSHTSPGRGELSPYATHDPVLGTPGSPLDPKSKLSVP